MMSQSDFIVASCLSRAISAKTHSDAQTANNELWMAIYMPSLPLVAAMANVTQTATVVCQKIYDQYRVISANKLAQKYGIRLNMNLSDARTLFPKLNILDRDVCAETLMMKQFANLANSWSPNIVIQNDHVLLLEIGSCLRINGGLPSLVRLVRKSLPCEKLDCTIAVTPTPASSVLCARSNYDICVTTRARLISHIGNISIENMAITKKQKDFLKQLGISQISELLRLPRTGLARRIGPDFVKTLDRLTGKQPDPQLIYNSPPYFKKGVDFEREIYNTEQLLTEARNLLIQLEVFLQNSCSSVDYLEWNLWNDSHFCTCIPIRLSRLRQQASLLIDLSKLALESSLPKGGITRISLCANPLPLSQSKNMSFLCDEESYKPDQLLNRLYIRLGSGSVRGICYQSEHPPEKAWAECEPGITNPIPSFIKRPLWLFNSPKSLSIQNGQPFFHGFLELTRHERIVTNWWSDESIQRDYYQAKSSRGLIWIFRELKTKAWYMHGIF